MPRLLVNLRAIRSRLGPLWWHTGLMFGASRIADLINVFIGVFLVPAWVEPEKLGVVLPVARLAALTAMPAVAVGGTVIKFIGRFLVRGEHGKVRSLLRDLAVFSFVVSLVAAAAVAVLWTPLCRALRIEDVRLLPWVLLLIAFSCWSPMLYGMAQGLGRFHLLSVARVAGPLARLAVIVAVLRPLQVTGYMAGQVAVVLGSMLVLLHAPWRYLRRHPMPASYREDLTDMARYTIPVAAGTLLIGLQQTVEPWAVRQLLSDADSAGYYMAYTFGSIPLWVAPAMLPFLFPVVSERHERGETTGRMHAQTLVGVLAVGLLLAAGLALWGRPILAWRPAWRAYVDYAPYAWILALATTVDTLLLCHIAHESACRRFTYLRYMAALLLAEAALLLLVTATVSWHGPWTAPLAARIAPHLNLPTLLAAMLIPRAFLLAGVIQTLLIFCNRSRSVPDNPVDDISRGDLRA